MTLVAGYAGRAQTLTSEIEPISSMTLVEGVPSALWYQASRAVWNAKEAPAKSPLVTSSRVSSPSGVRGRSRTASSPTVILASERPRDDVIRREVAGRVRSHSPSWAPITESLDMGQDELGST